MKMEIRGANPDDSDALTQIAHAAKRHWGYPERWMAEWRDILTITPGFITANEVYVAVDRGDPVGFYALVRDGSSRIVLDHLWVTPDRIGSGVGRELFNHLIRTASSLNATALEIESDPNAEGFYRRMGARVVGESTSVLDGQTRSLPRLVLDLPGTSEGDLESSS